MKLRSSFLFFFFIVAMSASAQEETLKKEVDPLQQLANEALVVSIETRLIGNGNIIWSTQSSRLTLPGRPVVVELEGSNIKIQSQFTPYVSFNDSLLLVAQSQVWVEEATDSQSIRTLSTLRSIPVHYNESVIFFPIGISDENNKDGFPVIAMELKIIQYRDYSEDTLEDQ